MNQHNLISIVPATQAEMMLDEETKSQKRQNLIERVRKLITRLSYVHEFSEEDKKKMNQDYQQVFRDLEKTLLNGKISWNGLSKVENKLNAVEGRIPHNKSIFSQLRTPVASAPIDLTSDDELKEVHNSSSICEDELWIADLTQDDETPQLNNEHIVPFSTDHRADKFREIVNMDELLNEVSRHSTMSNAEERPNFEECIDRTPALRILEMAKQNTGGKSLLPRTNSASSFLPTVPAPLDVMERVTKLIQVLPEEDKIVLKGGVDKVQELVEKKTKPTSALLNSTDSIQTSNLPRLSELLLEQMKDSEEVIPVPISSDKVPVIHPLSKPELSNNIIGKKVDLQSSVTTPKPVNIENRAMRPNQLTSISKVSMLKHPPNVRFGMPLVKRTTPDLLSSNEKLIPNKNDMDTSALDTGKKFLPYKGDRSTPLPIPNFTEPRKHDLKTKFNQEIGIVHKVGDKYKKAPSLKQLKSDLPFSTEKSLMNSNVKPLTNVTPSSHLKNINPKENKNLTNVKSALIRNQMSDTKSSSTQNQIPNDVKSLSHQSGQSSTIKKNHHRKPLPESMKKNLIQSNLPLRRRSSESSLKSNANILETNNPKLSTNFHSPLAGIYSGHYSSARTGRGYGAQKQFKNTYKIPRLNKIDKAEEKKSVMNQNDLRDDPILDINETISKSDITSVKNVLVKENEISIIDENRVEKSTVSMLSQKISQPKQIALKSSSSATKKISVKGMRVGYCKQNYEDNFCQNLTEDTMAEKLVVNLNSNEDSKSTKVHKDEQKDEELSDKSIPEPFAENYLSLAKPFSINLAELNRTLEKEKVAVMSKQDETIKLVDYTQEKSGNDQENSICSEKLVAKISNLSDLDIESVTKRDDNDLNLFEEFKRRKHLKLRKLVNSLDLNKESNDNESSHSGDDVERKDFKCKKLVTTSEESNSETLPEAQKRRKLRKSTNSKTVNTSDDSEAEIQNVPKPMNVYQKIMSSSDEENDSTEKSQQDEKSTVPSASSNTLRQCFNHCTCANDIMKILEDPTEEKIYSSSNLSVPGNNVPVIKVFKEDDSGEVTEPALNKKSAQKESEHRSNESVSLNQEEVKRQNNADLLDFFKSSSELENIREILEEIDVNEPDWYMHFFTHLPADKVTIVHKLMISYSAGQKEALNKNTRSISSEHNETGDDDNSMNEGQNSIIKNDQKIDSSEPVQSQMKPRKTCSRELNQLQKDIKEMRKTAKNNIFTAIGERKCRRNFKSYQNSSVKSQDLSVAALSHEDLESLSDDSVHSEKRLHEQPLPSTESIPDDNLSSSQFITRSRMQQVNKNPTRRGRRGRPPKTTLTQLEVHSTAKLESKTLPEFKPGPRCMKLKRYGKKALENQSIVKPFKVIVPKLEKPESSPEVDLSNHNKKVDEITKRATSEHEIIQCKTNEEDITHEEVPTSSDVEKAIRKKKKKRSKKKKAIEDEQLKKMLEECENTAATLNRLSTEERRRSSVSNLPVNEPENISLLGDADLERKSQEEHTQRKIASLPECNAFKKADVTHAQILCIAIELQDLELLYKCVSPDCDYSATDAKIFAGHVSFTHKDIIWNGDCPLCSKAVVMQSRTDLIDALSHLMEEHLTWATVEVVTTVILSDDDEETPTLSPEKSQKKEVSGLVNASNADAIHVDQDEELEMPSFCTNDDGARGKEVEVLSLADVDISENEMSTETSTPRLRVRRLSGDILSGTNSSDTPKDSTTQSVSSSKDGSEGPALSLVIKEVKTVREKELLNLLPHREECAARKNEGNLVQKPLSKSAQSELSIIKLYKCGGASWNNPETCKFSSDKSADFLLHLHRGHTCTNNKKEKRVAKKFLKCVYCGAPNADAEELVQHIDNVHGICLFQCAFCEYRAARPVYLDWHRENEHKLCERMVLVAEWKDNRDEVLKRSRSRQWSKPYQDIVIPFTCTSGCNYSTYSETQFIEHCNANHSGLQTWDCCLCNHKCFDLAKLMMHYKVHAMAKFQCLYCLYGAPTVVALKIHLAKHHPHLYPLAIERKSSSSDNEIVNDPWASRIAEIDLDQPVSDFKSCSKVIGVDSRGESSSVEKAPNSTVPALPMSAAEETAAAISAITGDENPSSAIPCQQNETRKASGSVVVSSYGSDDDASDRLISNEDESDDSNSTIAERLRQMRRASADFQQPLSRTRASKDYVRGLSDEALFKCGVAGCTIATHDYKAYVEHLRVCDNARNSAGFECPHCEYKVQTVKAFLNHLTLHGPARFLCTLCDFKHQQSKYVVEHMKSSAHRVHGEPKIIPIHPLKNDKHKDVFIIKFESDKILRNRGVRTPSSFTPPRLQRSPAPIPVNPPKQVEQITTVNSLEDVEKYLHEQIYRQYIMCGICDYKDRVRSNLLNHMKEHASGGLPIGQNIVNPVPRIGKDETDLMFYKTLNHAGFTAKNDDKLSRKSKDEMTNSADEADRTSSIVPEFVPKRQRYACSAPECRYFSLDASGLRHHYCNLHTDLTEFRCPHCQITVASIKISVHLRYHGEKLYRCAICRQYVHFQRSGIEKHQKEKHFDSDCDIEILREISVTDPEITDSEISSDHGVTAFSKVSWKCNLCGDRSSSEFVMISHCGKEHSISYKYKCCLCHFGSLQKDDVEEHFKTNHEASSKIFLTIYEQVDQITPTSSVRDQQKLKMPDINVIRNNRSPSNALDYDEVNFSSNSTPSSISLSDLTELNRVEQCSSTNLEIERMTNLKETNEMIVEPYSDQFFKCPFCPIFKTSNLKTMRYHLFKEKQYDRYVCHVCGQLGISRSDLEPHIVQEMDTHPLRNQNYICKFTADPILEQKVKEALMYQHRKMNPGSTYDPFSSLDSDEDVPRSSRSRSLQAEPTEMSPPQYSKRPIIPKHNPVFCCSVCDKIFTTQKLLTRHKITHRPKSTELQSPRKRASGESFLTDDSTTFYDESGKLNQSDSAKRTRYSCPAPGRSSIESIPMHLCKSCDKIFGEMSELREHEKMVHQPYPCLQCNEILLGEQGLTNHVRTSYRQLSNKQPNTVCIKSTLRRVVMKCPSPNCSYFLKNVSYQTYDNIKRHMNEVHPMQTACSVLVQIDTYEPRPLKDIEISYLQASEIPSPQPLMRAPLKRRNVAVKSTARPTACTVETSSKIMFVDPPTSVITTAGRNNSFITRIKSSGDENDAGTPTITEVIDLSDDAADKIDYYVH